jgi:hypothetical protein
LNRDTKKDLKIIGAVNPYIVQIQLMDYCPDKKVIIKLEEKVEK